MAFNPNLPANNTPLSAAELRAQLTGLADLLDQRLRDDTAGSVADMAPIELTISNPPTQLEVQTLVQKFNELLSGLQRR